MRERLIELLEDGLEESELQTNPEGECLGTNIEKFVDYLLQNGVVVLPCSVGDTVWYVTNGKYKDVRIENVHQWVSGHWKFDGWHGKGQYREGYELDLKDFGKTVFLTKEEAEKELERRMNND